MQDDVHISHYQDYIIDLAVFLVILSNTGVLQALAAQLLSVQKIDIIEYRTPVWSLWSRHSFAVACTISFSARSQFKDLTLMSFFLQCLHSMGNTAASFFYKRLVNTFRTRWQERQLNLWYSPDNGLYGRRLAFLINWMFGSVLSDWKYRYWINECWHMTCSGTILFLSKNAT